MTEIAEDDEGLVKIATRQVPCDGRAWVDCLPDTHILPEAAIGRCTYCDQEVLAFRPIPGPDNVRVRTRTENRPIQMQTVTNQGIVVMVTNQAVPVGMSVRLLCELQPHTRPEVRQLRWVHEDEEPDYYSGEQRLSTEPIPEGPEWTFTDPEGT